MRFWNNQREGSLLLTCDASLLPPLFWPWLQVGSSSSYTHCSLRFQAVFSKIPPGPTYPKDLRSTPSPSEPESSLPEVTVSNLLVPIAIDFSHPFSICSLSSLFRSQVSTERKHFLKLFILVSSRQNWGKMEILHIPQLKYTRCVALFWFLTYNIPVFLNVTQYRFQHGM